MGRRTAVRPERRVLWAAVAMLSVMVAGLASCGADDGSVETGRAGAEATTTGSEGTAGLAGVVREPAPDVSGSSLPEVVDVATGETEDFPFVAPGPDELLLMYFGYTSCPDVCPTTMADVRSALEALGPDAERVSVAMATVDPERDTAEVLDGYLRFFVPERSHVLRTEDFGQLHEAEQVFGASSALTPEADGEGYDVEHTGTLYVIDGEGRLVLEWPFGSVNFEQITDDLRQVLEVS
jgi:cytochrome oxidase Cu insertion factor (SCO1/SenC/PrrC family)